MKIKKFLVLACGFYFLLFSFSFAYADEYVPKGPLTLRNQNPVYLEFLNLEPTRAVVLPKGEYAIRLDTAYSNVFEMNGSVNYDELIHLEVVRPAFHFNAGVYDGMEAGIEIPFIRLQHGLLDKFLQDYHNLFGFPNAGRETQPNGAFTYYFKKDGVSLYEVSPESFGLGDITLNFKHNFIDEGELNPAVAWQFYFKLPTGRPSKGTGSGNPDFGFAVDLEKSYNRWHGYLNVGYLVNGGHAYLSDFYVNDVAFSSVLAGEFSVSRPISIIAQLTTGTPLLRNAGFSQWDSFPMDLQVGVKGEHKVPTFKCFGTSKLTWQAGFSEDLNSNGPSIDITIFASIGLKFGKN